jgi:hypothetical protein
MADFTTPMLCLPYNLAAAATTHCQINFADSSDGAQTVNFDLTTGSDLFTNRDYTRADNLLKDWVDAANNAISGFATPGEFTVAEQSSGNMKGMVTITYTVGTASDDITSIVWREPAIIGGLDFGFINDTEGPTNGPSPGDTHEWASDYVAGQQWIPHQAYPGCMLARDVPKKFTPVIETLSSSGKGTQDAGGTTTRRAVSILTVNAASVFEWAAAEAGHLETGQTSADPNVTLDDFIDVWRGKKTTALKTARWHRDMDTAGTYTEVLPLNPMLQGADSIAREAQPAPLKYDLDFELMHAS